MHVTACLIWLGNVACVDFGESQLVWTELNVSFVC